LVCPVEILVLKVNLYNFDVFLLFVETGYSAAADGKHSTVVQLIHSMKICLDVKLCNYSCKWVYDTADRRCHSAMVWSSYKFGNSMTRQNGTETETALQLLSAVHVGDLRQYI